MLQKQEFIIRKSGEGKILNETHEANDFYYNHIKYYIDAVKCISNFDYKFYNNSLVNIDVTENEMDEGLHIIITETWNDEFEREFLNPLFEDHFRPGIDYDECLVFLRKMLKSIDFR